LELDGLEERENLVMQAYRGTGATQFFELRRLRNMFNNIQRRKKVLDQRLKFLEGRMNFLQNQIFHKLKQDVIPRNIMRKYVNQPAFWQDYVWQGSNEAWQVRNMTFTPITWGADLIYVHYPLGENITNIGDAEARRALMGADLIGPSYLADPTSTIEDKEAWDEVVRRNLTVGLYQAPKKVIERQNNYDLMIARRARELLEEQRKGPKYGPKVYSITDVTLEDIQDKVIEGYDEVIRLYEEAKRQGGIFYWNLYGLLTQGRALGNVPRGAEQVVEEMVEERIGENNIQQHLVDLRWMGADWDALGQQPEGQAIPPDAIPDVIEPVQPDVEPVIPDVEPVQPVQPVQPVEPVPDVVPDVVPDQPPPVEVRDPRQWVDLEGPPQGPLNMDWEERVRRFGIADHNAASWKWLYPNGTLNITEYPSSYHEAKEIERNG